MEKLISSPYLLAGDAEVSRLRKEIVGLQTERDAVESKYGDALKAVDSLKVEKTSLLTDKGALNDLVASYQKIETELSATIRQLEKEKSDLVLAAAAEKESLEKDLGAVKADLVASANEAFKSLENGYLLCWERAVGAGYEMSGHTFEKYCEETAAADVVGSSNQGGPDVPAE